MVPKWINNFYRGSCKTLITFLPNKTKKLLEKITKCYGYVSALILLFFQKTLNDIIIQTQKKVLTILIHHRKNQFWEKTRKMKKINFAQSSFFVLFGFQPCKVLFAWNLLLAKCAKKLHFFLWPTYLLWNPKYKWFLNKNKEVQNLASNYENF